MRFWLPIAVVAFIACCIGIYYFFSDPYYSRLLQIKTSDALSTFSTPAELKDATYLLATHNSGGLYSGGTLTFDEYVKDGSALRDLVREGENEARIRLFPLTRAYELSVNGSVISEFTDEPRGLSLSPDGTYVSLAARKPGAPYMEPSSLELRVFNVLTGDSYVIEGFAGVFIDDRTILTFRANGAVLVDLESGTESMVREESVTAAYTSVSYDRESSLIAYGTIDGVVHVYEVITTPEFILAPLGNFKGDVGTIALTSQNVYVVSGRERGGSTIMRFGIFKGDAQVIRTLPSILELQKILP